MAKMVGIAEFKAKCERLISEMERDGEPIQLMRRGKVVGVLSPARQRRIDPDSLFGCMKGTMRWVSDNDLIRPASDEPWHAARGD